MKSKLIATIITALTVWLLDLVLCLPASAQGTTFTYQGRLTEHGGNYTGSAEFQPTLWNGAIAGSQVAANAPASLIVGVTNGLFVVLLDFGANFPGAERWLQLEVRTALGPFTTLSPRQRLTATPYALTASNLSGTLPAVQLSGVLPSAQLSGAYSGAVSLNNAANSLSGDGGGLTGLNAGQLASGTVPDGRLGANLARTNQVWLLGGNGVTMSGTHFLGTKDNLPLEFKVNELRAARIEFGGDSDDADALPDGAPNVILGAPVNFVSDGVVGATIAGGGATNHAGVARSNSISAHFSVVGGGYNNSIAENSPRSVIVGGVAHRIATNAYEGFIGGGSGNKIFSGSAISTIVGGVANDIGTNSSVSFIGGGNDNNISTDSGGSVIVGGVINRIGTNSPSGTVGGGFNNRIADGSEYGTIAGGDQNRIHNSSSDATIAGGNLNDIGTNSGASFVGGGRDNNIAANSLGSVIAGGIFNNINAGSFESSIGGGFFNTVLSNATYATIPGGRLNTATNNAFAAGTRAKANHSGAFVWADSTDADFASTGNNQFRVRATGGMDVVGSNTVETFKYSGSRSGGFATPVAYGENSNTAGNSSPTLRLVGLGGISNDGVLSVSTLGTGNIATFGNSSAFVSWVTTNGTWNALAYNPTSDRAAKENFTTVNPLDVLDKLTTLPISRWSYKAAPGLDHIGPVAQDFHALFGLNGDDDKHIATVDADGVALAAIQGLNEKVESGKRKAETRMQILEAENAELKQRLGALEKLINRPAVAQISTDKQSSPIK